MRDLLGGKGAGVAGDDACRSAGAPRFHHHYRGVQRLLRARREIPGRSLGAVEKSLKVVERTTGKGFGEPRNPLLVSVRSGAKFSMPGMMDTVLNLGLNSATLEGLAKLTNDRRFALDAHRRFIQLFSKIVLGIDGQLFEDALDKIKKRKKAKTDADLTAPALEELIVEIARSSSAIHAPGFPRIRWTSCGRRSAPCSKLWNNKRATDYRNYNRIPHDLGTAVNVQSMVFGNMGDISGTGVAFTGDPSTGEKKLYDDRRLGQRRVHHAVGAELVDEPVGDLERAAEHADVLAHQRARARRRGARRAARRRSPADT